MHYSFHIVLSLFFVSFSKTDPPEPLVYNNPYTNLITDGNLIPRIFELSSNGSQPFAVRIILKVQSTSLQKPLSMLAMRGSAVMSTMLPRILTTSDASYDYYFLAETLCEGKYCFSPNEFTETVRISVSSGVPLFFDLMVKQDFSFILGSTQVSRKISPSEPIFYRYTFPDGVDEIAIRIVSDENICGRITIQKATCPVFDTEGQIALYGDYIEQTILKNGYLILSKSQFGEEVHVILTVLPSDRNCRTDWNAKNDNPFRVKKFIMMVLGPPKRKYTLYVVVFIYALLLAAAIWIACQSRINNFNSEDNPETKNLWHSSLSQFYMIVPLALVIVSMKYRDSTFHLDYDQCNFNYECAIPLGIFKAFNNMLSASSIAVAAIINFAVTWRHRHWRRPFPLNMSIFITGVLWTAMNFCPHRQSYHLYVIAMIITVLEAKFLLFGKRNGRTLSHRTYIGSYALVFMTLLIFDTQLERHQVVHYILRGLIFIAQCAFTLWFSYFQGTFSYRKERAIEMDDDTLPILPEEEVIDEEPAQNLVEPPSTDPPAEQTGPPRNRCLKLVYLLASMMLIIFWSFIAPFKLSWVNSTYIVLRFAQMDFGAYFLFYCFNKRNEPNNWRNLKFLRSAVICVVGIIGWGLTSNFKLTTFVPWSPAESRDLNSGCIFACWTGIDWHDVLHYLSAIICFLYPIMITHIDTNLEGNHGTPF